MTQVTQLEYLIPMTVGSFNWQKAKYDDTRQKLEELKIKLKIELYYGNQELQDSTNGIKHARKRLIQIQGRPKRFVDDSEVVIYELGKQEAESEWDQSKRMAGG